MDESSPARRAADATRRLMRALVASGAPDGVLDRVASEVDRLARDLEPHARASRYDGTPGLVMGDRAANQAVLETHSVMGAANPLAPPLTIEVEGDEVVVGTVRYPHVYEGPPATVHGGQLAAAFDLVLATAAGLAGRPVLTGRLTVRYRRATPLDTELRFEGRLDGHDDRKVRSSARLYAGDDVTAEGEGLFIVVDSSRYQVARPA